LPVVIFVAEDNCKKLAGFVEAGFRSYADGCDVAQPVGFVEGRYQSVCAFQEELSSEESLERDRGG
jgi:hypothetical protein